MFVSPALVKKIPFFSLLTTVFGTKERLDRFRFFPLEDMATARNIVAWSGRDEKGW